MNFELTEDQKAVRAPSRALRRGRSRRSPAIDEAHEFPPNCSNNWRDLALRHPLSRVGGRSGLDLVTFCLALGEVGALASLAGCAAMQSLMGNQVPADAG